MDDDAGSRKDPLINKGTPEDRMRRAYRVAASALKAEMEATRPEEAAELHGVRTGEVVAVRGSYDKLGRVLEATGVPARQVDPEQLGGLDWDALQVLLVSCPGHLPPVALERLAPWVRAGGYLLTTDWALKNVVEPLFPGTVRHNGRQTSDCVVRVESAEAQQDPLLAGFLEAGREPLWWLEGSSYPIEVLDPARVRVLVRSREVAAHWDADAVVVTFEEGRGTVLHLLSHLYLQRSDVRTAADARPASAWLAAEAQLGGADLEACAAMAGDLRASELRSASSKTRLLTNLVLGARRRKQRVVDPEPGVEEERS
jgi:hypothetical protein